MFELHRTRYDKKSQLGQLLTYMVGHCVQNCSKDYVLYEPMLGLYMEGSKVCILCIRMIAITVVVLI